MNKINEFKEIISNPIEVILLMVLCASILFFLTVVLGFSTKEENLRAQRQSKNN